MKYYQSSWNDLFISRVGLGCMGLSGSYGAPVDEQSIARIHRAARAPGSAYIDTADSYGKGKNEELVGRAIRDRRSKVFLGSKFGRINDAANVKNNTVNGTPAYVRSSIEGSLKRLGVEQIDLYYLHRVDPKTPIEETVGAMGEPAVKAGKVRFLGLSEPSAATLRRAAAIHPISALQNEYSLFSRDVEENGILETVRELRIPLVPYSPIGRGILTGEVRSFESLPAKDSRLKHPRFQAENLAKNLQMIDALGALAKEQGLSTTQLALAWLVNQGDDICPIPGSKRIAHLEAERGRRRRQARRRDAREDRSDRAARRRGRTA